MKPTTYAQRRRRSRLTPWAVGVGVTIVGLAVALAVAVTNETPLDGSGGAAAPAVVRTGEQNAMGMPVIETPGAGSGTAAAASVEVDAANWELGAVPLNTAVRPSWVLRNTGAQPVTISEPHAEVREGCCPGPFSLDTRTIPPGGEATLSFELSMHPGMDGWHDIAVHVPLASGSTQGALELGVTGDFRDA